MNNNLQQRNFLIEFEEKGYDLEKLKPYNDFLVECSQKNYSNCPTQKHHILPKSMNDNKYGTEIIELSLLDHFESHRILAFCFDVGSEERRKNLSACKYIKVHIKKFMIKNNYDVPTEFDNFWNLAHDIMKDFNKGENNLFFGKKHSEETKSIIREKRKLQVFSEETRQKLSERQKGERNGFYGKTHSDETKKLISETKKRQNADKPKIERDLPEGVFKCNEIIDNQIKSFYRFCPTEDCNAKIFYVRSKYNLSNVLTAHKNNTVCQKCRSNLYKSNKPIIKINYTSNHLVIKDLETGIIYNSIKDAAHQLNLTGYKIKKMIKIGKFEIIKDCRYRNLK